MGFAGNCEPSFIIPSVIGTKDAAKARKDWKGLEDMDFWIGDEALSRAGEYMSSTPCQSLRACFGSLVAMTDGIIKFGSQLPA